ncbi:GAG-pre-integrase domain-containing protein [Pseudomonas tolaasii]|uniref:GAG-pre-integrase domain-containing protein n=1 Tax=Pseudomonas tolaasii TaxID=29442 RepID=UPI0012FD7D00
MQAKAIHLRVETSFEELDVITSYSIHYTKLYDVCNIYFGNKYVGSGYMNDGFYFLDNNDKYKLNASDLKECNAMVKTNSSSKYIWHLRLCHVAEDRIAKTGENGDSILIGL